MTSFDVQTAILTSSTFRLGIESLFAAWVLILFLGELLDFWEFYRDPERLMQERSEWRLAIHLSPTAHSLATLLFDALLGI